jgi:hypothetical protein
MAVVGFTVRGGQRAFDVEAEEGADRRVRGSSTVVEERQD